MRRICLQCVSMHPVRNARYYLKNGKAPSPLTMTKKQTQSKLKVVSTLRAPKNSTKIRREEEEKKRREALKEQAKKEKLAERKAKEAERKIELGDHKRTVKEAQEKNKKDGVRGKIRCGKLVHRFDKSVDDHSWPMVDGYMNINCCSSAPGDYKNLSPMRLGPFYYKTEWEGATPSETIKAENLENFWQFSKVWEGEDDTETNKPIDLFFERRKSGWEQVKGQRHVKKGKNPNGNRNIPLYSWWKGQKLLYQQAREAIYCPLYAAIVKETSAYKKIDKLLEEGYNVQIIGFDGYDYESQNKTLAECFQDQTRPFGHELVLCAMLGEGAVWPTHINATDFLLTGKDE
jgi:hypothetical protein